MGCGIAKYCIYIGGMAALALLYSASPPADINPRSCCPVPVVFAMADFPFRFLSLRLKWSTSLPR